jgi:mono/diheme cytochrome c family protein
MWGLSLLFLLIAASLTGSCADPATEAREQQVRGESAYATYCASCHEIDGGIGPRLRPPVLATRMTAAALLTYNRRNMPYQAGQTLPIEMYVDITAYLLVRGGFVDSTRVFKEAEAEGIALTAPPPSE